MTKTLSGTYAVNGYLLNPANQSVLNPVTVTGSIDLGTSPNGGALVGPNVPAGAWTIVNGGQISGETGAGIAP